MKKLFLVVILCGGVYNLYHYWEHYRAVHDYIDSHPGVLARPPTPAGFVDTLTPDGLNPNVMTVFMPEQCPLAAGVRGRALVARMKAAHIPVETSSEARMVVRASSQVELEAKEQVLMQGSKVLGEDPPIVFFRGRAKANPSFEDVLAEYRSDK